MKKNILRSCILLAIVLGYATAEAHTINIMDDNNGGCFSTSARVAVDISETLNDPKSCPNIKATIPYQEHIAQDWSGVQTGTHCTYDVHATYLNVKDGKQEYQLAGNFTIYENQPDNWEIDIWRNGAKGAFAPYALSAGVVNANGTYHIGITRGD